MSRLTLDLVRGASSLVFDAVSGITGVVEAMHADIAGHNAPGTPRASGRTRAITGLVYRSIHGVNGGVRALVGAALRPLASLPAGQDASAQEEIVAAVLNGVLGHHLHETGNPLALPMRLRHRHVAITPGDGDLAAQVPGATAKIAVLVHGLCMTDRQWTRDGASHADALVALGYTPLHLVYNSGRHVSENGRDFADLMQALQAHWPLPVGEIAIVAHSMGGLVARSACHYGRASAWRRLLRTLVCLGTPHHGAPLERGGNALETLLGKVPYAAALSRLGMARSAGITDLRYGNLLDEDWADDDRFARRGDRRRVVPLPEDVRCCFAAATTSASDSGALVGDGLVPVASALGEHADAERALVLPEAQRWLGWGMNHFDLLHHPDAHARVAAWLAPP